MPMGFEVTKQMIKDDADINFQLIVHAGDIAYGGVSHEWEFEVRPAPKQAIDSSH
jgi:predicted phosphodiesterase